MKNVLMVMALVCSFVSQTNCLLTEKLAAASSKIVVAKSDLKAGNFTIKVNTCGEGSGNCKSGCVKA